MREYYDLQLEELNNRMIEMSALVESSVSNGTKALLEGGEDKIKQVEKSEALINRKEKDIESLCVRLIMHNQPVAGDLRFISAVLKMVTDLERIGDYADDIAEIAAYREAGRLSVEIGGFSALAEATVDMVNKGIVAFVNRDINLAKKVIDMGDKVDTLFVEIRERLADGVKSGEYSSEPALDLVLVDKYFERIGDHAVNIAEWVIYSLTGELEEPDCNGGDML